MSRIQRGSSRRGKLGLGYFPWALLPAAFRGAAPHLGRADRRSQLRRLAALWVAGTLLLALVTGVCALLGLGFSASAFVYLIAIVVLSLLDSFVSSAIFSVASVSLLNFFFVQPRYSLTVHDPEDLATLASFLITSLVVTSLIRRVRTLGEAQREQAQLLDLTTDAVFVRDPDNVIVYWNRGATELYGWTRAEAVGRITHELLATVFPTSLSEIDEVLSRTGRWEGELLHTTRSGTTVTVASRWSLQRDDSGQPIGTLESNSDITERKRAEDALQRSQAAYLAEAQQLSHTGSFGWNVTTGQFFWSDETFAIFGYAPTIAPTLDTVLDRVHPDDAAHVKELLAQAARDVDDVAFETRLLMPDGSVKHLDVVAHAAPNGSDHREFIGAVSDVTDRVRAQAALNRVQADFAHAARVAVLGELTASIAHEVNQPLAAIAANSQAGLRWLSRPEPDIVELRDLTESIVSDTQRAADIISRIRAMAANRTPELIALPLDDIIREAVLFLRPEIQARGVTVVHHTAALAPPVLGDRTQLHQVIVNLTVNAIQAIVQGERTVREIAIRTSAPAPDIVLCTVEDSGPGINAEHLPRLFDSFFTTKTDGLGMGLSICRSIIEAHGGRITADNLDPGPGARIRFTLPAARSPG